MKDKFTSEIIFTILTTLGGLLIYQLLFFFLKKWARKKKRFIPSLLEKHLYFPGLFIMILISCWFGLLLVENHLDIKTTRILKHVIIVTAICAWALLLSRIILVLVNITLHRLAATEHGDYSHRKARTKFELVQRILNVLILIATISLVLMTFKSVRQVGSTLLASAGVLGLILGIAAQKSLGALFAGIQIAISQPIRIDDVVVVEDQFGTIGEITLTYVVVNTWDGRRLVVPINFFLENSFENWTRSTAEVIGKVSLNVDYSLPVEQIRPVFENWVKQSPLWDGRSVGMVVTDADDRSMVIRGTMSARNSGDAFDLECEIREKMIKYIRENFPHCLPRLRMVAENDNAPKE